MINIRRFLHQFSLELLHFLFSQRWIVSKLQRLSLVLSFPFPQSEVFIGEEGLSVGVGGNFLRDLGDPLHPVEGRGHGEGGAGRERPELEWRRRR